MNNRSIHINLIFNILLVTVVFFVLLWIKLPAGKFQIAKYLSPFLVFLCIWITVSSISNKYDAAMRFDRIKIMMHIIGVNLLISSIVALNMYVLRVEYFSRFVVIGTIIITTIVELILSIMTYYIQNAYELKEFLDIPLPTKGFVEKGVLYGTKTKEPEQKQNEVPENIKNLIIEESNENVLLFVSKHINFNSENSSLFSTTTKFNIDKLPNNSCSNLINLKRINDIRYINKFFESINHKLTHGGTFIGRVETKDQRKRRILAKFPIVLNRFYYFFDFIIKRVLPKFAITKNIYFFLTRGNNRVITETETLGRLYSCGFEISHREEIDGNLYFVAKKKCTPHFNMEASYGPLIKLKRIGKDGKKINVYKLRTMHPYSEYLQEYIYKRSELKEGGKFKNDFRITSEGRFFRKYWIDELPMLINLFKGELKLFGVRPLSEHYYSLYSKELQELRKKTKPGLIPPFYADLPKTLDEIQASEMKYLEEYFKKPIRTDWKYFWKATSNILFKNARSQ